MTSEQIFAIRDLDYLYKLWHSKIPDNERIDVATMIGRIEAHRAEKAKESFNPNEQPIIKNNNYNEILER